MSWINDKIRKCDEISSQGKKSPNNGAFYLFLVPRTDIGESIVILNAKLADDSDFKSVPFQVGCWNPVVVSEVNLSSDNILKYRVFWGSE